MATVIYTEDGGWFNRIDDYVGETKEEAIKHMNELVQQLDSNVLSNIAHIMHPNYSANVSVIKIDTEKYLALLTLEKDATNSIIRSITVKTEFEYHTDMDYQHWTEVVQSAYSALTEAQGNY